MDTDKKEMRDEFIPNLAVMTSYVSAVSDPGSLGCGFAGLGPSVVSNCSFLHRLR